jgi:ribosomal-protein-alanine acetyltransferase
VKIRSATPADIPFMLALEHDCPSAAHWAEEQYQQMFQPEVGAPERLVLIGESHVVQSAVVQSTEDAFSSIVGFLVAQNVAGEWELENIVVAPAMRRQGMGKRLLEALLAMARKTNGASVFLEVRESNAAARGFYEAAGFRLTGKRKSYYVNPIENALLYRRDLA